MLYKLNGKCNSIMKICILTPAFPPEKIGGTEIYIETIVKKLIDRGHKVTIVTLSTSNGIFRPFLIQDYQAGIKFYKLYPLIPIISPFSKFFLSRVLWRIVDLLNPITALIVKYIINKERPDVIHINATYGFSPVFLNIILKRIKLSKIITLHNFGFICFKCDLFKFTGKNCLNLPLICNLYAKTIKASLNNLAEVAIFASNFCLNIYSRQKFFRSTEKIILPYGIKITNNFLLENEYDDNSKFNIIFIGRLVKNKGVQVLINAFRRLNKPDIRLYVIGNGGYKDELMQLAGQDKRIIFPGFIPNEKLGWYYKLASVTVVPSLYQEPFGIVAIESLAAGTPVIGSRTGGIPEIIKEGYNGYLFTPGNSFELMDILEHLMENPAELETLKKNSFESARKFNIETHVDELEKIYAKSYNS